MAAELPQETSTEAVNYSIFQFILNIERIY